MFTFSGDSLSSSSLASVLFWGTPYIYIRWPQALSWGAAPAVCVAGPLHIVSCC